jgi:uncharacterized protein YjiS (DUF1127 family)
MESPVDAKVLTGDIHDDAIVPFAAPLVFPKHFCQNEARPVASPVDTILEWRWRMNSRRELAALSALDLKDIGHPPQAEAEKAKPFWQA